MANDRSGFNEHFPQKSVDLTVALTYGLAVYAEGQSSVWSTVSGGNGTNPS